MTRPAAGRSAASRWCSSPTRSSRTSPWPRTSSSAFACARSPTADSEAETRGRAARPRDAARAQALAALRRPAAARGARPRDHRRDAGVPHGRAALQPRRAAARRDAPRDPRAAAAPRHHDGLRHPRPDRGDDAWPTRSCCCAPAASSRSARPRSSTRGPPPLFAARFIGTPPMNLDALRRRRGCVSGRAARGHAPRRGERPRGAPCESRRVPRRRFAGRCAQLGSAARVARARCPGRAQRSRCGRRAVQPRAGTRDHEHHFDAQTGGRKP